MTAIVPDGMVSFEELYSSLDQDERDILIYCYNHTELLHTTTRIGETLEFSVDENGNGREWISRLLDKFARCWLEVAPYDRYPRPEQGTPYPGFRGPLMKVADGFERHKPYMMQVPTYVMLRVVRALKTNQLGAASLRAEVRRLEKQLGELRQRVGDA